MILCPKCSTLHDNSRRQCPSCYFSPQEIDGFEIWAPEFAKAANGNFFDPENFKGLANLEADYFWFRARNELILWAIRRYCGEPIHFAEIGCGTGFVLSAVARFFPKTTLLGSEAFTQGLKFAAERIPSAKLVQLDARQLPYRDEFDVIGIFDVLEHIEEDEKVLQEIYAALKTEGYLILTVPQHAWLWNWTDEEAYHVRRYNKNELHAKLQTTGFEIVRSTSFVSLLLPLMMISRLTGQGKPKDIHTEFRIHPRLNRVLEWIMGLERALIRAGFNLDIGGSRLVVAKKIEVTYDPIQ